MEYELPRYEDIFLKEHSTYFINPQYRFNTFYNCNISLKYYINDYVKSGFFFKYPNKIVCYNCGLENVLSINIDPCIIHKRNKTVCKYALKRTLHNNNSKSELILIMLLFSILVFFCAIIACIHVSTKCLQYIC